MASNSTVRVSAKRKRARAAGLCSTCCKIRPKKGRSVCDICSRSGSQRKIRSYTAKRQRAELQKIVIAHERAGDRAQEHHLFDDAAQHFQEALSVAAIAPDDRIRLLEKFRSVAFLSENPAATSPWRNAVPDSYFGDIGKASEAVNTLLRIAGHRMVNSRVEDSLSLYTQVIRIAEIHGLEQSRKIATVHMVSYLNALGRFTEASQYLERLGKITSTDDLAIRINYYSLKGCMAGIFGLVHEANEHFERAIHYAKEDTDLYRITSVFGDYAVVTVGLGDIERGKTLYEQALLIVRRNHMGWLIPQLCMGYASILARMGQHVRAHDYLREALASDTHYPLVEERFAAVGIPLALHLYDNATLMKCTRPTAIDSAFQSREPQRIGPLAAAFAQLYATQRKLQKSHKILHKALEFVNYVDESIDLPLAVARYGTLEDLPRARALLEQRMRLPAASVAEACITLFDAFVEQRTPKGARLQQLAMDAMERFDRLHWYGYGDLARSLVPFDRFKSRARIANERPLATSLLILTEREQQVVELVLRGNTNKAIAERLAISEHTVEKHMGSIMNRLGIRSRHQLAEALAGSS